MSKKKIVSLCLVVCLLAIAAMGTLAYFTDEDSKTNTFTTGDVQIEVREENADGTPFTNDQEILPGVLVNKYVYADNVGPNDAYVRVTFMWPKQYDEITNIQFWRYWDTKWSLSNKSKDVSTYTDTLWATKIGNDEYTCFTFYCDDPVESGETAGDFRLMSTFSIPKSFDWVDKDAGIYTVGNGDDKIEVTCTNPNLPIGLTVKAEAIQADGFADVWTAFTAYDAQN